MRRLHARAEGPRGREAAARLRRDGPNRLQPPSRSSLLRSIPLRLGNPLILVLLCASSISALRANAVSFVFVVVVVLMSIALDMAICATPPSHCRRDAPAPGIHAGATHPRPPRRRGLRPRKPNARRRR